MNVMNHFAIPRTQFGGDNPLIFSQACGHCVLVRPRRGEVVFGNRKDKIGLSDFPAVGKRGLRRQIFRISFRFAAIGPGANGRDLQSRKPRVV